MNNAPTTKATAKQIEKLQAEVTRLRKAGFDYASPVLQSALSKVEALCRPATEW